MNQRATRERYVSDKTEIVSHLTVEPRSLPSKLFYNDRGSKLFDEICRLEEYYPTRTEMKIISANIREIAEYIGENALLMELGSGSSSKIRLLLDHLADLAAYVPIDISGEHLYESVDKLQSMYPDIRIIPIVADYTRPFELPAFDFHYKNKVLFYPGSTIGNFKPDQAVHFLKLCATLAGSSGSLLVGVDMIKDKAVMEAAYNDRKGVTAAFNRNILYHVNELLDTDFVPVKFEHKAFFNEDESRIEMHLVSREYQEVHLGEEILRFNPGDSIHTENSYKYSYQKFRDIAERAGFKIRQAWTDEKKYFSVLFLTRV